MLPWMLVIIKYVAKLSLFNGITYNEIISNDEKESLCIFVWFYNQRKKEK